jgi:hypothetical protein
MRLAAAILSSLFSLSACAEQKASSPQNVMETPFAGTTAKLIEDQGRCALSHSGGGSLRLDMKWPCHFSKNTQNKVLIEDFRKAEIVMVEHSEPASSKSQGCATDAQAIRYLNGKVEAAPVRRVTACPPMYWDEKDFTWLFDW